MMRKKVLISGASIAGLTLAYFMKREGHEVTVVEIASAPRRGGSPIDVRGQALEVAERMGILEKIKAGKTRIEYLDFVNAADQTLGTIPLQEVGAQQPERI